MRVRVLATTAVCASLLAWPCAAFAQDEGAGAVVLVSDDDHVQLTQDADKANIQTGSVTLSNTGADKVDVTVGDGDESNTCEVTADPDEVKGQRTQKVKLTFTDCDTDEKAIKFDLTADTTFTNLTADPPTTPDLNWLAILGIFAAVGVGAAVLLAIVWARWKKHTPVGNVNNPPPDAKGQAQPPSKMTLPGLEATWKFADSWAANATVVTAVFTGVFGAKEVITALLGDSGKNLISVALVAAAISVGMAGVSPMLAQGLRRREEKRDEWVDPVDQTKYAEIPAGLYVTARGLVVAGTVTLAATGGQLGVILYELEKTDFWPLWATLVNAAIAGVLLGWYAVTATRQNLTTGAMRSPAKTKAAGEAEVAGLKAADSFRGLAPDGTNVVSVVNTYVQAPETRKPAAIL